MNGRSDGSGPAPLRGRRRRPSSTMSSRRVVTRKTDPSAAGAFSNAVRSAMSPPWKVASDDRPQVAANDGGGFVVEVACVEAAAKFAQFAGLQGAGRGKAGGRGRDENLS